MQRQVWMRRILYVGIVLFLFYYIVLRRRSTRVFLIPSHITEYHLRKLVNDTSRPRIPRIIHQTWKSEHVPSHWQETVQSVRQLNADQFEYRLWTDDQMHEFVRQVEPNFYEQTFLTYSLDIQRVDAFRYVLLYHFGGVYIDMDNGCRQSLESLLDILETFDSHAVHLAAFPQTTPLGISNGFMIATKGHPLFRTLISRLSLFNHNYLIDYLTVMFSAGPSYLSIHEFYFDSKSSQSAIRIIDDLVYSGIYTWHTPGNSWHGNDAKVILYIYHSVRRVFRELFYAICVILSCILVLCLSRCYLRWRRRERRLGFY